MITKLTIPDNTIKCSEDRASNFSFSRAKVKDICNQMKHFNSEHKDSKVEIIKKDVQDHKSYPKR